MEKEENKKLVQNWKLNSFRIKRKLKNLKKVESTKCRVYPIITINCRFEREGQAHKEAQRNN